MAMETTIENIYDKEYHRDSFNKSYCSNGNCNCKKNGSHCSSHCSCNKKKCENLSESE